MNDVKTRLKDKNIFAEKMLPLLTAVIPNLSYEGENYLTSYMFAIELYNLYYEDKEKALDTLKKIILLDNKSAKQTYQNINKLGLKANQGLKKYQKQLTKL